MSEEPKKSRRRRRRPRSSAKKRAKAASNPAASGNASGSSSGNRRGKSRRRPSGGKSRKRQPQDDLTIQQHTEQPISPISKDIFIYTYTLRPRSLLDSYEAGPNVAEKMAFEQPDQRPLDE